MFLQCTSCGKLFGSQSNLVKHIKAVHLKIRFKCDYCEKSFTQTDSLRRHQKAVHLVCYIYITIGTCGLCKKFFQKQSSLKQHVDGVHRKIRYPCDLCEKSFSQLGNLKRHKKYSSTFTNVHIYTFDTKVDKYTICTSICYAFCHHSSQCTFCGKMFNKRGRLKLHVEGVHLDVKYKCNICGRSFTQLGNVRRHKASVHARD
ncbi:hypothetical protein LSH36_79g11008 [Paralvinella palmiformis]|uniref:C2H2-type domain-containing protein n=1 Tax=Paralvinella palmiformis TaxID=53620 RepID=A0AAD9NCT2_9ANNE|nr:hypothetical protein LSH36_79g11008 [Paralvinella palmiformis]